MIFEFTILDFYPRPPGGGRLLPLLFAFLCPTISIHALRVEGDDKGGAKRGELSHFYPRPPGGGRLARIDSGLPANQFLSTPSGWRATRTRRWRSAITANFYPRPPGGGRLLPLLFAFLCPTISIHALRVEGDDKGGAKRGELSHFYPRPPGGGRLARIDSGLPANQFLSTPSGWRATRTRRWRSAITANFYPRPPGGGRLPVWIWIIVGFLDFYPRPPGGGRLDSVEFVNNVTCISIHALRVEGDNLE